MFHKYVSFTNILKEYFLKNKFVKRSWSKEGIGGLTDEIHNEVIQRKKNTFDKSNNLKKPKRRKNIGFKKDECLDWILSDGNVFQVRTKMKRNVQSKRKLRRHGDLYVDSYNSLKIGKHPIRNSTRPQKFSKPPIESSIFYNQNKALFDEFDVNVDRCVISKGCWHTNKSTLQRQLISEIEGEYSRVDKGMNIRMFDRSARNVIRKLGIETLPTCGKEQIFYTSYNAETYAGFRYDQYLKKTKKKEALLDAVKLAVKRWDRIEAGNFSRNDIMPSIYTIGARNKRDFSYEEDESANSRVVHMPEFHVELTSGPWTDQITDFFKNRKTGPIFIGNSFLDYERLDSALNIGGEVLEGDWRRFDSTIYVIIKICTIAVERLFYALDDENIDNHFIAIFDSIGINDYYTPGGNMIRAFHGLPSGVKSTGITGSIINNFALDKCINDGANKDFNYVTGGDDFDLACRVVGKICKEFIEDFKERAIAIGMRLKFLKVKHTSSNYLEDLPCFYKYVVTVDKKPAIPTSAMLERVFMPWNKNYTTLSELCKFLDDVMPSLGNPGSNLILYYLFYQFCMQRFLKRKIELSYIITKHHLVYNKMMQKKEMPDRFEDANFMIPLTTIRNTVILKTEWLTKLDCFVEKLVLNFV